MVVCFLTIDRILRYIVLYWGMSCIILRNVAEHFVYTENITLYYTTWQEFAISSETKKVTKLILKHSSLCFSISQEMWFSLGGLIVAT